MNSLLAKEILDRRQLLETELARYLKILSDVADLERVIVFGSLVEGNVSRWSDIDLVIVQKTDLPFFSRLRAVRRLLRPRVATDLLVYTPSEFKQLSKSRLFIQQEILVRGKVVYERSIRH
ncbi:MAG: nucleotidyltransferase domain-containing protein [Chloroflexota bacterium]